MSDLSVRIILGLILAVLVVGVVRSGAGRSRAVAPAAGAPAGPDASGPWEAFQKPGEEVLRDRLNDVQYRVTQQEGTEPPFNNAYWDNDRDGIYVDVVSGEPLFSSQDKFKSGTGWPSFVRPLVPPHVTEHEDVSLGMRRVEVRSKYADSHLGHLFEDGPAPTGLRYCINSAALRFVPADRLEEQGYGEFAALFAGDAAAARPRAGGTSVATFAGGCFWGMEDIIRDIPGVLETDVGYTGGETPDATYADVKRGSSGHAESVRIVFDPEVVGYDDLLVTFFRMHDPTTKNRQGNDVGSQYRSVIFYHDRNQQETAERVKKEIDASGKWKNPIVTEIVPAGRFWPAEEYHQDYLEKNPGGYTCHFLREW